MQSGFPTPFGYFPSYTPLPQAPQVGLPYPQSGAFPWNPYIGFPNPYFSGFAPAIRNPLIYFLGDLSGRVLPMSPGRPILESVPLQASSESAIPPNLQSSASITELSQMQRTPSPSPLPVSPPTPVMPQPQATDSHSHQAVMAQIEPVREKPIDAIILYEDEMLVLDESQPVDGQGMEDSTGRPTPEELSAMEKELLNLVEMSSEGDKTESELKVMPLRTPFKSRRTRLQWEGVRSDAVKSALKRHRNVVLSTVVHKQFQCSVCQAKGIEQFYAHKATLVRHTKDKHA